MRFSVDAHAVGCHLTGNEVYIRNLLIEFARLDFVAAVLYSSVYVAAGFAFSGVISAVMSHMHSATRAIEWLLALALLGRDDALASTQFRLFAAGVEQCFGKHPLELVRDHAQLSVIHRGLLSLFLKQHAQEECRMDHRKNLQQNQILKSTYL